VKQIINKYWNEKPLSLILFIAVFLRLIAVIFSKGFGWHDDHFLVIEAAQSWVDGTDYNRWLPINGNVTPSGHSFFYPGIHFIVLSFLEWIGMTEPQSKMYVIRLLHAALSLIIVVIGYRIVGKLTNQKTARITGLMLAGYWFMPFLSVRNLVEFVSIPLLMMMFWSMIKYEGQNKLFKSFFIAGLFGGMAMCVRFQSAIFIAGVGMALLLQLKWKHLSFFGAGALLFFLLEQGLSDYLIWGKPLVEFLEYVQYNINNATTYLTNTWYSYTILILGIFLPPVSLFLFWGFLRTWKKYLILFLPTLLFLVFHSYFPNKQERFILTIVPFIIILGVMGWTQFVNASVFWLKRKRLLNGCYIVSLSLNCIALPFVTTFYTKEATVESMTYLSADSSIQSLVFEDSNHSRVRLAPRFYLKKWIPVYEITTEEPLEEFIKHHPVSDSASQPDYILFFEEKNLEKRVSNLKSIYPNLHYVTMIGQGFIDDLLHRMNPNNNVNQIIYIYKVR
jgi:hypothetical protein